MSRLNAKVRCNYYPLPLREAERIRNLLRFPAEQFSALDPCIGDGAAFAAITRHSSARRYGIELDRAEQAGPSLAATTTLCRSEKRKESEISCGFRSSRFRPWILASETARRSLRLPGIPAQDATELNWMPIAPNKPGPHLPRLFRETVWKPIAPSSRSRSAFAIPRTTGRSQVTLGNDLRRCS